MAHLKSFVFTYVLDIFMFFFNAFNAFFFFRNQLRTTALNYNSLHNHFV